MERNIVPMTDQPHHGQGSNSTASSSQSERSSARNEHEMERSIVPARNPPHHGQVSNSTAASSQSGRSFSVRPGISMPSREARECNHFGIRQYVRGIREKDRKICLPFNSNGDSDQILPPMDVVKNEYWDCENCLHGSGSVRHLEEVVPNEMEVAENGSDDSNIDRAIALSLAPFSGKNEKCSEVVQMTGIVAVKSRKEFYSLGEEPGNGVAGRSGLNQATKVNKGKIVNSQLVKRPRKKTKKRSIEDCMREEGNSEASPSNSTPGVPSTSSASFSLPKSKGNYHENILGFRVPQKKRNIRVAIEKKPMENGVLEGNTDISTKEILIISSDSEGKEDGTDHGTAGRGVISSISYKDFMGKFNFCAGESSFSHKSTASPNIEAVLKNVMDKISRHYAKEREKRNLSPMPSDKNFPLVQNLDFSSSHYNEKIGPKRIVKLFGIDLEQEKAKGENVRRAPPSDDQPRMDVCITNRNPADFSCPDAGTEFMINGQELKVRKEVLSRGKTVRKKKRARKNTPSNEHRQT